MTDTQQSASALAVEADVPLDGISARLCEAVSQLRYEDIPSDVLHTVKLFVLDTMGVIGGASKAPGIPEVNSRFARWENGGSATSLLTGRRHSPPHAALVNGAAAHALDFDDMHDPARVHSFCVVLPAILAAAEDIGNVDGKTFLTALAIAAEMHARLGYTCYNSLGKGWHPTMTLGVLAATLGIGRMLDLKGPRMLDAFGIASHQVCGSAQSMLDGVLSKRLGAGIAARGAVTAAFLAADGVTGPFRPLEGNAGLFRLHERDEVRPEELLAGLGEVWQTRGYSFKPFPCCRCNHTSISLAFDLLERGLQPEQIEEVTIRLPQVNFQTVGERYDVGRDSIVHAQFNVSYSFARALVDGKVDLRSYTRPFISEPAVVALAEKVRAVLDPSEPPTAMGPSKITVRLRDGSTQEIAGDLVPGSPDRPMTESEIVEKFRGSMAFGLDPARSDLDRLTEVILGLDTLPDIAQLVSAFPSRQVAMQA